MRRMRLIVFKVNLTLIICSITKTNWLFFPSLPPSFPPPAPFLPPSLTSFLSSFFTLGLLTDRHSIDNAVAWIESHFIFPEEWSYGWVYKWEPGWWWFTPRWGGKWCPCKALIFLESPCKKGTLLVIVTVSWPLLKSCLHSPINIGHWWERILSG